MMESLLQFDCNLFFLLNGSDSIFWDGLMWNISQTWTWFFFYTVLLVAIIRHSGGWSTALGVVLAIALCILLSDRISSGIFKPLFERWRPSRDPLIGPLVDVVNGYRGGKYGFCSSHAANTFGLATLLVLSIKVPSRNSILLIGFRVALFLWAALVSYSRIYLGVHYPGDVFCGALVGIFSAWLSWTVLKWSSHRWGNRLKVKGAISLPPLAILWIVGSMALTFLFFVALYLVSDNPFG